jgi:hypothetical protein
LRYATLSAAAFAAVLAAVAAPAAFAAPTPAPRTSPILIHLPDIPLHTEVVVEVNDKGQVVRVKATKPCKIQSFNLQTYGNALQMWIRKCRSQGNTTSCTAETGLYRVTYDYDPKTQSVTRRVALISPGGSWAHDEGAANVMIEMAKKQAQAAEEEERKAQQEQNAKLPSLNQIRGVATPKPTPVATLPPY